MSILGQIQRISTEYNNNKKKDSENKNYNSMKSIIFESDLRDCDVEFRLISGIDVDENGDPIIQEPINVRFVKNPKNQDDKVSVIVGLDKEKDEKYLEYFQELKKLDYGHIYKYKTQKYRKVFIYFNKLLKGNFKLDLHKVYIAYIKETEFMNILEKFNKKVENGYMTISQVNDFFDFSKESEYVIYYSGKKKKRGNFDLIEREYTLEQTNSLKPIDLTKSGVNDVEKFKLSQVGFWRNDIEFGNMKEKLDKAVLFIRNEYENYAQYKEKSKINKINEAEKKLEEEKKQEEIKESQSLVNGNNDDNKPPFDVDEKIESDKPECFGDSKILDVSNKKCSEDCSHFIECVSKTYAK